ncbi:restriction endonuclease subunit S [Corallococcus exercitus]|uniref:restriction endonuclease subunit S n=1 Tax=Corallococcus exercitus TaxID=2316736 RepID=UPI0011C36B9F|nr:restriction endonuclease subunit S [Corallococcus exercitus]
MAKGSATWKRVKFGEVVRLVKETCKDPVAAGVERVIGLEHLEPGDLRVRSWSYIADGTTFTTRVRPGQVLFGKRRAYQRKVAVADFDAICSGDIYVFESASPERLLPELLPFICQADAFFEHAVGTSAGSLSPRTNWSSLAEYEFALPPVEEQRRVLPMMAASTYVLQETLSLVTAAKTLLRAGLSRLFLLPTIPRRNLVTASPGWQVKSLEELADPSRPVSYGVLKPGEPVNEGVPMLRVMDFDDYGRRTDTPVLRVARAVADTSSTTYCRAGDLVVSVMATIGRTFVVPQAMDGWNMNRALALVPCREAQVARLLHAYFQSGFVQSLLSAEKIGSAQPRINLADLRTLPVPVPNALDTVLENCDRLFATLDHAERRHDQARAVVSQLRARALS